MISLKHEFESLAVCRDLVVAPEQTAVVRGSWLAAIFAILFTAYGCDSGAPVGGATVSSPGQTQRAVDPHQKMKIVATTGMVAELVQKVVGDRGTVDGLMGPGADPHLFRPTRNDVRRLMQADMIVYSGLQLEHRLQETIERMGQSGIQVIAVTSRLDPSRLRPLGTGTGQFDPHVWMDVSLWSECVRGVAAKFAAIDPPHAEGYHARAAAYVAELQELDAYVRQVIESIPEESRLLVTAHDAFGYFSDRYGIEVQAVQGVSTESEAGVQDINALVDLLVSRKVPALFVESSVSPKSLQAVLEGCRSRGVPVRLGGELYSDAMGPPGTYEGTYVGMLDANATRIASALGGTAPSGGWRGHFTLPISNTTSP